MSLLFIHWLVLDSVATFAALFGFFSNGEVNMSLPTGTVNIEDLTQSALYPR